MLAASVPGLLMLATFGLQRLESGICPGNARDGAELTKQPALRPARARAAFRIGLPVVPVAARGLRGARR
ncbi:hypothetical protein MMUR_00850 [Mycolicibacterium murale]|uniref:Uncharacterized protein n=1 Tax=Mycolicibacterium murale TaxID=182220 RepID=A0A7I9WEN9_9MYCO|nr:hypothetical protein MMUR_00850 [Mycolicibacterium murale]